TVGHQWADLSERYYGVALLNDCKYGYDIKENTLRLSLLKAANFPDPTADKGLHQFTYSLYPHSGDWYEGNVVEEAWNLNNPIYHQQAAVINEDQSLFNLRNKGTTIDAIKRSESGDYVVIRLHDYSGGKY